GEPRPGGSIAGPQTDLAPATCHYISPEIALTFSIPPGFVTRDSKHGPGAGCFWGTREDIDRVLASGKGADFGKIQKGVFQAHLSTSSAYDTRTGQVADEWETLKDLERARFTRAKEEARQSVK